MALKESAVKENNGFKYTVSTTKNDFGPGYLPRMHLKSFVTDDGKEWKVQKVEDEMGTVKTPSKFRPDLKAFYQLGIYTVSHGEETIHAVVRGFAIDEETWYLHLVYGDVDRDETQRVFDDQMDQFSTTTFPRWLVDIARKYGDKLPPELADLIREHQDDYKKSPDGDA